MLISRIIRLHRSTSRSLRGWFGIEDHVEIGEVVDKVGALFVSMP